MCQKIHFDHVIDDESAKYLKENSPKPGRFYTIPKMHKQGNPGRPIVSSNSHPTERISQFVDHHLQPLVTKLPSYIKDTTHFRSGLNLFHNCLSCVHDCDDQSYLRIILRSCMYVCMRTLFKTGWPNQLRGCYPEGPCIDLKLS